MPIRVDRRGCSYRPTQMFVSTDADVRIDRRRCSYRPTRMLVTVDADHLTIIVCLVKRL
ncbi:hypothetical protein [Leyella stercorea]|uniref:hypothetical protein n=1 Tax=Leyella stercorea TaxID=363265 RepID=UPI00266C9BF5|nr:hypothetical protein [Leyella stercorea]